MNVFRFSTQFSLRPFTLSRARCKDEDWDFMAVGASLGKKTPEEAGNALSPQVPHNEIYSRIKVKKDYAFDENNRVFPCISIEYDIPVRHFSNITFRKIEMKR